MRLVYIKCVNCREFYNMNKNTNIIIKEGDEGNYNICTFKTNNEVRVF